MENLNKTTTRDRFFNPLKDALLNVNSTRKCKDFSDFESIQSGVGRVLDSVKSGRDWVQKLQYFISHTITVNCFFSALKSKRRLGLLIEVNLYLVSKCDLMAKDPFKKHDELNGFALYAMDGHYHGCSAHEDKFMEKKHAPASIYALNLRTESLQHLDVMRPDHANDKVKEHDISVMKRLHPETLRMGQSKGTKVVIVYDPAIVDYKLWHRWKQGKGIYVITREKANSKLITSGDRQFDRNDPRNNGVKADIFVGNSSTGLLRRIIYTDPVHGTTYTFLTNEMTLPPGLIAFIYKRRWDIEKVYDVKKNKFDERKAWGNTVEAKCQQANFICIAHNLMLLLEQALEEEEGITDEKLIQRIIARKQEQAKKAQKADRVMNQLVFLWHRPSQRSFQFIRWLRNEVGTQASWSDSVVRLRPLMKGYLR
jgi:Transposase DDE domain